VLRARDVPQLLAALQAGDATRPRLTWYGPEGERVELSARVLANWVAKTANLLVEEFEAGPGTVICVDLPTHWKTVIIHLAALATGADITGPPDLVVTADPAPGDGPVLAVALPALARRFPGDLGGALDYAAEVLGHDDVFVATSPTALPPLTAAPDGCPRVLLRTDDPQVVDRALAALRRDGSVVLAVPQIDDAVLAVENATR
jgi:uncharacterized protein (TIGR03089 family)